MAAELPPGYTLTGYYSHKGRLIPMYGRSHTLETWAAVGAAWREREARMYEHAYADYRDVRGLSDPNDTRGT